MTIIPVLATAVDWKALNGAAKEILGEAVSRELDVRGIPTNNPRALRLLFDTAQAEELCHLGFFCSGLIPIECLRDYADLHYVTLQEGRNSWTGIITGSFDQWERLVKNKDQKIKDFAASVAQYVRQL